VLVDVHTQDRSPTVDQFRKCIELSATPSGVPTAPRGAPSQPQLETGWDLNGDSGK
jgi:hypothetical protein